MQTNILEYLEQTVPRVPDKTAFADENSAITFGELYQNARAIGTKLLADGISGEPVVRFTKEVEERTKS